MSFATPSKLLQTDAILVLPLLFWQIPDTASAVFWFGLVARDVSACQGSHSAQGHALSAGNVVKPPVLEESCLDPSHREVVWR